MRVIRQPQNLSICHKTHKLHMCCGVAMMIMMMYAGKVNMDFHETDHFIDYIFKKIGIFILAICNILCSYSTVFFWAYLLKTADFE